MKRVVKILSKEELDKRYQLNNKSMAFILTREAIKNGYSIALIEQEGLDQASLREPSKLLYYVRIALESIISKSSYIEIWGFTDMSELPEDKIYCAFKELEGMATLILLHKVDYLKCRKQSIIYIIDY